MRVLLIVNAVASSVTPRARVVIQKALAADHDLKVATTSRRGHATQMAAESAAEGIEIVVVLGGDGTLNEAANGLAGSRSALAVLPGGSTNVFARTIGCLDDPIEATGQLLGSLARNNRTRIGMGQANGRYFLFHVGMGLDAAIVGQVERRARLKRYAGHPLFVYAGFSTYARHFDRSRPALTVTYQDGSTSQAVFFAICQNTDPYTYLGRRRLSISPEATFDRGLAIFASRTIKARSTLAIIVSALGRGRLLNHHSKLDRRVDQDHIRIDGSTPFAYQVDGDYLGLTDSVELGHAPDILDLILPA
ncbi:MAG: diacylglycerol/lipid kinase family protein [Acidimicrobiales bacterium]